MPPTSFTAGAAALATKRPQEPPCHQGLGRGIYCAACGAQSASSSRATWDRLHIRRSGLAPVLLILGQGGLLALRGRVLPQLADPPIEMPLDLFRRTRGSTTGGQNLCVSRRCGRAGARGAALLHAPGRLSIAGGVDAQPGVPDSPGWWGWAASALLLVGGLRCAVGTTVETRSPVRFAYRTRAIWARRQRHRAGDLGVSVWAMFRLGMGGDR